MAAASVGAPLSPRTIQPSRKPKTDDALQDAAIIAVRRSTFLVEIGMYIATYRGTHNANTLENIQNRYLAAKADLLEPRLPATIEELVATLEVL